jgi:hypothetical protein
MPAPMLAGCHRGDVADLEMPPWSPQLASFVPSTEAIMRISKDIQIPLIVFSLQAVLLVGTALVFIVLIPR